MGEPECGRSIDSDLRSPIRGEGAFACDQLCEGLTLHVLHDDEVRVLVLAPVVDGDNAGMVQVGSSLGFPTEPGNKGWFSSELREQNLDRNRPVQQLILGQEHVSHTASGDSPMQFVPSVQDMVRS